ncbi:protein-L-isoaspartate O-methyltransferase [Patescibacteria group bacterium]|nr:protein-L-isoaspartate O-methyltransferase [Patescibacteria group bacterium]
MDTNRDLIDELIRTGYLKSERLIRAFEKVDRKDFVPLEFMAEAYGNYPLAIGYGQTISQPATVAFMLEKLQPELGDKVLDVGCGSGWQTALLAELIGPTGRIVGIEIKDNLVILGNQNLKKYNYQNAKIIKGNGWQGLPETAPFAKIIVAAAAEKIPKALAEQLEIGGRLVIPVGKGQQDIVVVDRIDESHFKEQHYPGFIFVPLVEH